eukprot:TRINITY_DN2600_c0_g2_i1.p1 TRINITY_DN2600_c0_g2~~TRINITY_DN2600_c0_g2_i1.p1  ORF type:complete len:137 (-),score=21.44 TRINITY_DN2600_c0_g2_i1:328-738(-)
MVWTLKVRVLTGGGESLFSDRFGALAPYVAVTVGGDCSAWRDGQLEQRTSLAKISGGNLDWNQDLDFGSPEAPLRSIDCLKVRLYDEDMFNADLVGEAEHEFADLQLDEGRPQPFKLMMSLTRDGFVRVVVTLVRV